MPKELIEYQTGDVILFRGRHPFSFLISLHNLFVYKHHWEYTHAAIISSISKKNVYVCEALTDGFAKTQYTRKQFDKMMRSKDIIVGRPIVKPKYILFICERYIGRPYSFLDLFGCLLYFLIGKHAFLFSTGAKQVICSEAIARILYDATNRKINFEKEYDKPYDIITPLDIYFSEQIIFLN